MYYSCIIYSGHAVVPAAAMATHYHLKTIEKIPHYLENATNSWKGLQTVHLVDCNGLYQALVDNALSRTLLLN